MIQVKEFFDGITFTLTYVVWDSESLDAVVIDPVLDYDPASSRTSTQSIEPVIDFLRSKNLRLHIIFETHAHADHLSGSQILKIAFPNSQIAIGERITEVQEVFKSVFGLPSEFKTNGSQFDRLLNDNETVEAGKVVVKVLFTPGHTPACASLLIGDCLFVGDALFMPDYGTGRCDFPSGSASSLYHSIQSRIYSLPDETKIYTGHDYLPGDRPLQFMSTVKDEKDKNIQLRASTTEAEFIAMRNSRDQYLATPRLLLPSVQINIAAGHLPTPDINTSLRYLRIPIY